MELKKARRLEGKRAFSYGTIVNATIDPITDSKSQWFIDLSTTDGRRHRAVVSEILRSVNGRPAEFKPESKVAVDTDQYSEYKLSSDTLQLR